MQSPQAAHAPSAPQAPAAPVIAGNAPASEGPVALTPVPEGGGRLIVDRQGDRTIFTTAGLPPEVMLLTQRAQETAFGLMGLLAVIIIVGPFARMWARRMEKRPELERVDRSAQLLQQQLVQLQQSMDAMSVEVERISEAQRFQSRLLGEKRSS
ncbi:MAG: hypothetical protein JWM95_1328 [Gemmatimonadetes bacterium]|nr:hypothetical protein [Gemmatimonadota bacterium]